MSAGDIDGALQTLLRAIIADAEVALGPDTVLRELPGWDSFKMVELIVQAEDRFGIMLETRDLDKVKLLGDLGRVIATKRSLR